MGNVQFEEPTLPPNELRIIRPLACPPAEWSSSACLAVTSFDVVAFSDSSD